MSEHLEVVGYGRASAAPDVVNLDLRVSVDGDDVSTPLAAASVTMARIHDVAGQFDISSADLQTSGAGVQQRWGGEPHGPIGFTAYQRVTIRLRDLSRAGELISRAQEVAGDHFGLDGIWLAVADEEPLRQSARDAAFGHARRKAEQFAALAGRGLGRVLSVSELGSATATPGGPELRLMAAKADLPVAAGEAEITASVVVRFAWADGQQP